MRVAIVVPRYGRDVLGGAETLARGFAEEAVEQGWSVEVWTTCARSHYTWKNVHAEGIEDDDGLTVRRFRVQVQDPNRHAALLEKLDYREHLPKEEHGDWLSSGAHSPGLYAHVGRHAHEFDLVVALPAVAPLVHYAAWIVPDRVVVLPCLHDEPTAYLEPIRMLMEEVRGVMFLSPEEKELALLRLGVRPQQVALLGGGVDAGASGCEMPNTDGRARDLLYVGRLEEGKGLLLLYRYVQRFADEGGDIRLIVLGRGPVEPPDHPAIEYRGFVSEDERRRAYCSSGALCQPSVNESFSLTIMESWLAGRPVLVRGDCAVTRGHVQRSKGGLWFSSYEEFAEAVGWLRANPHLGDRMGENGRQYVRRNYTWPAVVERFGRFVQAWKADGG
jgi:glycosyltransferase involved in cell wall biosynthesis